MSRIFRFPGLLPYICIAFLNAFVDLGHKIVIQNTVFKVYDGQLQIVLTAIVNALILLPFILLFTPAGYLSDKHPKNNVMRISALAGAALTLLITLFYYLGLFWPAFLMTFLMAIQSAIYSPAKYGYIKELVGKENLAWANGLVQATSIISILMGTFVFSILFEKFLSQDTYLQARPIMLEVAPIGWFLIASATLELILAYSLPQKYPKDDAMAFDWQAYRNGKYLRDNIRTVFNRDVIRLSIIGLSIFWAIGQVLLAAFPAFAKESLGITNAAVLQGIIACSGIGIMTGSLIAARISRNYIETGLIPIGSCGVMLCLMLAPQLDSGVGHAVNFVLLGISGGLFIIPLNALIQFHAGENELGKILAGNNFVQNITMLGFLALTAVIAMLGMSSSIIFYILMVIAAGGTVYTLWKLPQSLVRFLIGFAIGQRYRLEVIGLRNMPEKGGVLLLGNHISWLDWAIIQMASPRPIRFVMAKDIYQRWYLQKFLDFFGVIPISAGSSKGALQSVGELLNQGQVVCLFPEGTISRTGQLGEFHRGYEKAAAEAAGVILPFYLRGLWGTRFSRSSGKLKSIRKTGIKRDIIVAFGEPMPMQTTANNVKQRVFELSLTSWQRYTRDLPTLPEALFDTVRRMPDETAVIDNGGASLSYRKLGIACLCFSALIKKYSRRRNVGILLPTTSAGVIVNMAALMSGKTVVNLNYTASPEAIAAAVRKADIDTVYTSSRFLDKLAKKGVDLAPVLAGTRVLHMEDLKDQISSSMKLKAMLMLSLLPAAFLKMWYCRKIHSESPAAILFSSGSEGEPKGVMLSHRNFMANLKQISDVLNTESTDVVMATLPLFHAFGLTVTMYMPLIEGIPMVCHPDPTDAANIGQAVARYKATILCATSTFLRLYTKNQRVHPLMFASLRIVVAGAEKLDPDVRDAFKLKFNKDIYEGYGATETTPVASVNIPDSLDTVYWKPQVGNKTGTVGMPLPGTSFRVVDPATMQRLGPGEDGLILIGGAQVMLGYLNDEAKTKNVIVEMDNELWYKTGDKGHLDEDGFLTIVDRYSRFAKLGGEMISLGAVENNVRKVIGNLDLEVVAVNLPDEKKGERIEILTNQEISPDELRRLLLDAGTSPLMVPSGVTHVDAIPKLGSGKTDFGAAKKLLLENYQQAG